MNTSYILFWIEKGNPKMQEFKPDELTDMLQYSQELYKRKYAGENITHIASGTEDMNLVSNGINEPPANYSWPKRRIINYVSFDNY